MLIIRKAQMQVLFDAAEERLVRKVAAWIREAWPDECGDLSDADLEVSTEGDVTLALSFGFRSDRDVTRLVNLAFALRPTFPDPIEHPWAFPILDDLRLTPAEKLDALWEEARHARLPAGLRATRQVAP